jgi:hypothetical protein
MLRTNITRSVRLFATRRLLSTTPRVMAGGDTGSGFSRPSGERAGDAFTRREAASEELYIRQEERAKLLAIREKLAAQKKHIEELDKHIEDLTKDHGGEHN